MTKWIRWTGILGFVAVVALLALFFIIALPWMIKGSIEYVGTKVAGAKVSVDDVDVTLSPLGVTLTRLQVADARAPMTNLVEFSEAVADLELAPLLVGKAISNELSITGLEFHTERSSSGAIEKPVADSNSEAEPSLQEKTLEALPDASEILARETLKTPQAKEALQTTWTSREAEVNAALEAVPDSAALSRYETELTAITSGRLQSLEDFKERKARLDALKKQFAQDRKAVTQARDVIQESRRDVQQKLADLKSAPGEDLRYLRDKYQLNGAGVSNLTGLLFGDDAAGWAREALYWYDKVSPYLESEDAPEEAKEEKPARLSGRFVNFPTSDPWPAFMIRNARITGPFDGGQLVIAGRDITHQQMVTGRPTVFTAQGSDLKRIGDLDAVLTLDHTRSKGQDTLTVTVTDWAMAPLSLGVAGAELASSRVRIDAKAVVAGGELDATAKALVSQANFRGDGQTLFARELNQALSGVTQFTVKAGAEGELTSPQIHFGSDLDRQINAALSARLRQKQDELEARLSKRLNALVSESAGEYADELQQLINMEGSMDERLEALTRLASAELEDFKAQQEREAREKADAEKAAAEAKAKAEADAKKDELKKKANDKLKNLF